VFRARCEPSFELTEHAAILRYVQPLLEDLERYLRSRQQAIRELRLQLRHRPDRQAVQGTLVTVRLSSPAFESGQLRSLLEEHLARVQLPAPVIRLELCSGALQPLETMSVSLWKPGEHGGEAMQASTTLIERLRARLGAAAVYGLRLVAEHRPERAWAISEPDPSPLDPFESGSLGSGKVGSRLRGHSPDETLRLRMAARRRPLWLLQRPERLANGLQGWVLLEGPECIETGWWDGHDIERDYYVARDPAGARLWVFHERRAPGHWFLQGVFG
jgi:protein ImuB